MAEVSGQGHDKECAESVGAVCVCECRGRMHGMRATRTAKLRRMGQVNVTAVHGARAATASTSSERRRNPVTLRTNEGSAIIDVTVRKDGTIKESRAATVRERDTARLRGGGQQPANVVEKGPATPNRAITDTATVKPPETAQPGPKPGSNEPLWKNARTGQPVKYPSRNEITAGVVIRDRQAENLRAAENAGDGTAVELDIFGLPIGVLGGTNSINDRPAPPKGGVKGQQLGMFADESNEVEGQGGLFSGMNLDAVADSPAGDAYDRPGAVTQLTRPDPVQVPDDLSSLDDDRLDELASKVDDEGSLLRLVRELERREDADRYAAVVDAVPDADGLRSVGEADLERHYLELTAVDHQVDGEALRRVEAELDRRDAEERARLEAEQQAKRDHQVITDYIDAVITDPSATEDDLEDAAQHASSLGDQTRLVQLFDVWDRREKAAQARLDAEQAERDRVDAERLAAQQQAVREEAARVAAEQAEAEQLEAEFRGMYPSQLSSEFVRNAASMDPVKQRRHAAAVREMARRAEEKKADDARTKIVERQNRMSRGPVNTLADDELNEAIAGIEADGYNTNAIRQQRLVELKTERVVRDAEAARVAALKAATPTEPARLRNPIGALGDLVRWSEHDQGVRDRLERARMAALGVPEPEVTGGNEWSVWKEKQKARKKAIAEYAKGDPRSAQEQAAAIIAQYRHLAKVDNPAVKDEYERARVFGPDDEKNAPLLVPAEPFEAIPKAYEVFQDIRRQAMQDRADGNNATAARLEKASRRGLGLPDDATDDEVRSAYGADERKGDRLQSQMLVEYRALARAEGVDPDDRARYGPKEKRKKAPGSPGYRVKPTPQQEAEVDRRVSSGEDYLEAYAAVYGLDPDAMKREQGPKLTGPEIKAAYEEHVHLQYLDAETATSGHMLSAKGKAAGKDPVALFSGSINQARPYASEELLRYWQQNERLTFADFKANLSGNMAAVKARAGRSNGRDFV